MIETLQKIQKFLYRLGEIKKDGEYILSTDDYKKSKGLIMQLDALIEAASHQADPADPQKPSGG